MILSLLLVASLSKNCERVLRNYQECMTNSVMNHEFTSEELKASDEACREIVDNEAFKYHCVGNK